MLKNAGHPVNTEDFSDPDDVCINVFQVLF